MLSYKDSLNVLKKTKALLEGHFVLTSGLHSNRYVQCAKLLSDPKAGDRIKSTEGKDFNIFSAKELHILDAALGSLRSFAHWTYLLLCKPEARTK